MGASFRSAMQVLELAGCMKLTVSPKILNELNSMPRSKVIRKLPSEGETQSKLEKLKIDEAQFR